MEQQTQAKKSHAVPARVAVLGLGFMGAAIAAQLCRDGHQVTVWNRSPGKAAALQALGAECAGSAADAVANAEVVLGLQAHCSDLANLLAEGGMRLNGKDVVNLATGGPDQVHALQAQVLLSGGAGFLHGCIAGYPEDIGCAEAALLLGGDRQVWERREALLRRLAGKAVLTSEVAAAPCVVETALVGGFVQGAHAAFLEAAGYATRAGMDVQALGAFLPGVMQALRTEIEVSIAAIASGDFSTTQATLHTYARSLQTFQHTMAQSGASTCLIDGNLRRMRAAIAAGDGALGFAALVRH